MATINNLKQLMKYVGEGSHQDAVLSFGRYRGKKLFEVPTDYVEWARKETEKEKLLAPKKIYEIYQSCVAKATEVPFNIPWEDLPKEEKKIWELFAEEVLKLE